MRPTKIYVKSLLPLVAGEGPSLVRAMAHITGGGLPDNIPRVVRDDLQVVIDVTSWEMPPVFRWMQSTGSGVAPAEMARTFNIGIGMVLVVDASNEVAVLTALRKTGESATRIGVIRVKPDGGPGVVLENLDKAFGVA